MAPLLEAISPREEEVLLCIADGLGMREIAKRLGVTHWTVKTHRDEARRKLGARTQTQAVAIVVAARARTRA